MTVLEQKLKEGVQIPNTTKKAKELLYEDKVLKGVDGKYAYWAYSDYYHIGNIENNEVYIVEGIKKVLNYLKG